MSLGVRDPGPSPKQWIARGPSKLELCFLACSLSFVLMMSLHILSRAKLCYSMITVQVWDAAQSLL